MLIKNSKAGMGIGLFVLLSVIIFSGVSFAHCIWVETPIIAEVGDVLDFDTFYANVDDPIAQRDMDDMQLEVRLPNGDIEDVNMNRKDTFYEVTKDFAQKGEYVFSLTREPAGFMRVTHDMGKSIVLVGDQRPNHNPIGLDLEITLVSNPEDIVEGEELEFQVLFKGEPIATDDVRVHKAQRGEEVFTENYQRLEADNNGRFKLNLNRNYNYILESRYTIEGIRDTRYRTTFYLPTL
ncbi:DUF4198 domain-containing protein [Halonatronum saccharophilum]|uniref:DUF4198 domain-containing protein n=1 Tax=Halonatronum saccharophilum TaxID=150060 RepID=UPI0004849CDD|nr:DUF4198 domain-containing protein [Halonatronum saccharophilum]